MHFENENGLKPHFCPLLALNGPFLGQHIFFSNKQITFEDLRWERERERERKIKEEEEEEEEEEEIILFLQTNKLQITKLINNLVYKKGASHPYNVQDWHPFGSYSILLLFLIKRNWTTHTQETRSPQRQSSQSSFATSFQPEE